jgi:hypothetical protein
VKPVYQSTYSVGDGDCLAACLASLLEVDLGELADFHARYVAAHKAWRGLTPEQRLAEQARLNGDCPWWMEVARELAPRGLIPAHVPVTREFIPPRGYSIAIGFPEMSAHEHACVYLDGRLAHDPTPGAPGLEVVTECVILLPAAPGFGGHVLGSAPRRSP